MNQEMKPELATAYVVFQEYSQIYGPMEAWEKGTVFHDLYRPYAEGKGKEK
jgi:hypothetical protein